MNIISGVAYFSAEKLLILGSSACERPHKRYSLLFVNMLHEQIKNGIKEAMLAKDALRLKAFRAMSAAFTNELVAKNRKPQEMLKDEEAISVIGKLAKQRKDSIEQFKKGNREDLVKEEELELTILETYLPKLMGKSEVEKIAKAKKDELGITDGTKKGMLMSALMKDLKGKADGGVVKQVVDSLF
ncbi:MAG: GatB/YqeY domain-containing protein [bacterium]|nr:GatB/YqeY domain-containing protein [bacterium]